MKKGILFLIAAILLQTGNSYAASTSWHENESKGAKTRLIASFYKDSKGTTKLIAAVHFKIAKGWKIYGHGSESFGLPPTFDFSKSQNFLKSETFWPKPKVEKEVFGDESITYFSYGGEIILPIKIDLKDLSKATTLNVELNYGLCKDVCVPANENFNLEIPQAEDSQILSEIQKFLSEKITTTKSVDNPTSKTKKSSMTLIWVILLALIGGAILNIMPCVLPVLSIKLLSVIEHSNAKLSRIRFAFFSTILGILSCFVLFALAATAIKFTGNSLGWGLQFQSPYFLIFLILVLTIFIINLLEIFEINFSQTLATFLDKRINKGEGENNIFIPNFLSGILAVLLATPCSAPFLGTAISFALVESIFVIFAIFIAIGIGFASPYFILLAMPKLVKLLPKPGKWMQKVKKLMALLLIATVLWLLYILMNNVGTISAIAVIILTMLLISCAKIKHNFLRYAAITLTIALTFSLPSDLANKPTSKTEYFDRIWSKFDEMEIYKQINNGNVVVVDITADWCLTCKFNKVRVLHDKEVMAKLKESNIIALRGDITKPDAEIMKYLKKNNRFAIPFNAVYGPNAKKGLLTSEFLTKEELLELINQAR